MRGSVRYIRNVALMLLAKHHGCVDDQGGQVRVRSPALLKHWRVLNRWLSRTHWLQLSILGEIFDHDQDDELIPTEELAEVTSQIAAAYSDVLPPLSTNRIYREFVSVKSRAIHDMITQRIAGHDEYMRFRAAVVARNGNLLDRIRTTFGPRSFWETEITLNLVQLRSDIV